MPAPATVADLVELIRKSGLIPEDRLREEVDRLPTVNPPSVDHFAQSLVRAGLLTRFQAKQLKIGRYKRFDVAEKYRLLEVLGVGGMGAVYLCEHKFMKRLVALKVLPSDKLGEQSALLRFQREARAVAALDHPNIVRAYDIDRFEQLHFLVLEYVDGHSIQEIVARNGPFSPDRAANYIAQAALGLDHAHDMGMVHRDIKPGNLLLERTGVVKLLDMGLAKFFAHTHDNVTEKFDNNSILGTADYLAPEQAVSNVVDVRADIYALGGTFYFMLTGQVPFPDGTVAAKLMAHQTKDPRPVTEFRKDVPAELLAVLRTMMAKKPDQRYQTPHDVLEALAHWSEFPVPRPPDHEMPDLCPAVLALAGHATEKIKAAANKASSSRAGLMSGGRSKVLPPWPGSTSTVADPSSDSVALSQAQVPTTTGTPVTTPLSESTAGRPLDPLTDSTVDIVPPPFDPPTMRSGLRPTGPVHHGWLLVGVASGVGISVLALAVAFVIWFLL